MAKHGNPDSPSSLSGIQIPGGAFQKRTGEIAEIVFNALVEPIKVKRKRKLGLARAVRERRSLLAGRSGISLSGAGRSASILG